MLLEAASYLYTIRFLFSEAIQKLLKPFGSIDLAFAVQAWNLHSVKQTVKRFN
jgi:hypothetical protein